MTQADSRRWMVLTLLSLTQFILVIDVSIVNVALADIQSALDFSQENLQWILSAYTLTFGGLLLLGGRMGGAGCSSSASASSSSAPRCAASRSPS